MPRTSRRKTPKPRFTAAEFFAGIGLVRLALEQTKDWRVVYANDIDPQKQQMYAAKFGDDHFHLKDIHELDPDDIPDCDLYTASFPCNDLSIAGKWAGLNGSASKAYWGFIKLLEKKGDKRPPLVLLENVVGFLMRHNGEDFDEALRVLTKLGYTVDAFILNASHWVPQSRARLFVVAKRHDGTPRSTDIEESEARPRRLVEFIESRTDVAWDIQRLPALPKLKTTLATVIEDLDEDDTNWWSTARAKYFYNQMSPSHKKVAKQMITADRVSYATAFRRMREGESRAELRTDGIAGCLRTPRGGSARQILFAAGRGKYRVRLLTPRECARLQGVPDDYPIDVTLNRALFGFGDAVCVSVITWIARSYFKPCIRLLMEDRECKV